MKNGTVAGLLIVAILVGAGAGYIVGVGASGSQTVKTTTTTSTTTLTAIITVNSTQLLVPLASQCSHAEAPAPTGLLFGTATAGTNSPAIICVQFYYFNPTTPTTLPTNIMIQAAQTNRSFSGNSNFTIGASENQLVFGGPQNENEGAVVAFAVTAKPGTSGTYELSFSGNYMLAPSEPVECAYYGTLVVGNGQPLYVFPGGCISYAVTGTGTGSLPSISGISYPILTNTLYFRVVGLINSTS